jgi:hypothetical protein
MACPVNLSLRLSSEVHQSSRQSHCSPPASAAASRRRSACHRRLHHLTERRMCLRACGLRRRRGGVVGRQRSGTRRGSGRTGEERWVSLLKSRHRHRLHSPVESETCCQYFQCVQSGGERRGLLTCCESADDEAAAGRRMKGSTYSGVALRAHCLS